MADKDELIASAKAVLEKNDEGIYTVPSRTLYPHQWLWDSCMIAIGLANYDIERAQTEILSLFRGQWANGMMPNIIFSKKHGERFDKDVWRSWLNPNSPDDVTTTGITQPPLLAEAIVRIGQKLSVAERHTWYKTVLPKLVAYHHWIYEDRDPHQEGLALLIHPWETGLDNNPAWMSELHSHSMPFWIKVISKLHLGWIINLFRRDLKLVPKEQRPTTEEILSDYVVQRRLRRKAYNINKVLPHAMFAIEDLVFNSILVRANHHLIEIAKSIKFDLDEALIESMKKTEEALKTLWDPYTREFYSRNFVNHELLKEPSIATFLPFYAGKVDEDIADLLIKALESRHLFGPTYPVPTAPINSSYFNEKNYWQGPTWINTNWLIIDGLKRNGFDEHADALKEVTLELVEKNGLYEYFSPISGEPAGIPDFSWTAALTIDLVSNK